MIGIIFEEEESFEGGGEGEEEVHFQEETPYH